MHEQKGKELLQSSRWVDALSEFKQTLALDTSNTRAYVAAAYCYNRLNQFSEAAQMASKALSLNASEGHALAERATAYINLKEYDKAAADLKAGLELDPDNSYFHRQLSLCLEQLGNKEEAAAELKKATKPDVATQVDFDSCYKKAEALFEANEYKACIPLLTRAYELNSDVLSSIHDRGAAYARLGDFESAIKDYNFCLQKNPQYFRCFYHRGVAELCLKQYDKASADFRKFIEASTWGDGESCYAVLFGYIAERKLKNEKQAIALLEEGNDKLQDRWPYPIVRFLAGRGTENALLAEAGNDKMRQTEVRTNLGMNLSCLGKTKEAANYLQWVKKNGDRSSDEYGIVTTELATLEK